jgi:Spy/CpxP family protein refolding chaperone
MKAFRIAALGFALVAGTAVVASAQAAPQQQGGNRGARPDQRLKDISLTPEQQAKIEEINKKYAPEMQVIRESMQNGGDRAEGMKKMNDFRAKISPEIRAVLTPEQQAIYDKNTADMKARMDAMAKQAPPAI